MQKHATTAEHARLAEIRDQTFGWRRWGPYVSERSWATVREDYSLNGDAWSFLPHELARSKAYRWGEDGIAGICDRYQILAFAPAFWNGRDPILKERLFGLTPHEGNHGEDVKEYYFHVDNTPTHSYMKYVYKYPHAEFPYQQLIDENRRRAAENGGEFELLDTGVFDQDRYFDITIEYAKADEEDICVRIEAINHGPEAAALHLIPQIWFRNTWCWGNQPKPEPTIVGERSENGGIRLVADDLDLELVENLPMHYRLGKRVLYAPPGGEPLFTDNETNLARIFGAGWTKRRPFVKDAFHRRIVDGEDCTNPAGRGTKGAIHYLFDAVPSGGSVVLRLRLSDKLVAGDKLLSQVDEIVAERRAEADDFYADIHPPDASDDEKLIQRQALAGLLWNKQCYILDVQRWLEGDNPDFPPDAGRIKNRNRHWRHLNSLRIMTLPDKWEYPWFAAWDLAFHCVSLALVDPQYAMDQLWVLLFEQFQHPNGQIPAYEWEFSDLNPPVHAWAVWRIYNMARRRGHADRGFLERCFHKLLINFAWWVNKVDSQGNNVFEGGFLGLDNITVFDRSMKFADGVVLEQSDATGWMGMFCLNLMRIALELAKENSEYQRLATKFFQHFVYVAAAMKRMGGRNYQLWDEDDEFFYDVLRFPDGRFEKIRVRSLVGMIPLFAVERIDEELIEQFPNFFAEFNWFVTNKQNLVGDLVRPIESEGKKSYVLSIANQKQLTSLLARLCDGNEFLSDFGIRSLSKAHEHDPFEFEGKIVRYEPAEAPNYCKLKGGNSNWRGPIWFPTTFLLIESLRKLGKAWGPDYSIDDPAGGCRITTREMAASLADRLIRIFRRDKSTQRRPVYGGTEKFQTDPHWRDLILFYEYFHGDNGAGLGASHQTGWTSLVASLIDEWRR
jgi:hypothetical protein